jgi:MYXO-CTERM domain-containing protein
MLSACTSELATYSDSYSITNGDAVQVGDLPTIVGIASNAGSVCTGTLISPTTVLTAAHCVEPMLLKQAMQQAGMDPPETIEYRFSFALDLKTADESEFMEVESVEWHAEFLQDILGLFQRPGKWNDIAIMKLATPVTDRPVQRLATPDVMNAMEMELTHLVAGYGLTNDDDMMTAGALTEGISHLNERGENELIAGSADMQQACRGDSGGPIFADEDDVLQIGVASRINASLFPPPTEPPPCETGLLYTRVDTYLPWIEERVPDLGQQPDPMDPDDDPNDPSPPDPGNPGDPQGGGGGGGCSASGSQTGTGALLFVAFAALLVARRRRRS